MLSLLDSNENVKRIYLVRHGETSSTNKGRICGNSDVPLTDEGIYQTQIVASWFKDQEVSSIFASPLQRTCEMAEEISEVILLPTYYKHSGLLEKKEGDWEGKTYWEIRDSNPKLWERWSEDPIHISAPNGESVSDFVARCGRAFKDIIMNYETGNDVVLVTHAGVIKGIIMNVLGIPVENFFRIDIPLASISRLDHSENFTTLKYLGLTLEAYSYTVA